MPILTNDLRSPDQRRSDQLTILRRRPLPPKSAGRFFKIVAETAAYAIGKFDPCFDSDAETDGPTSGSSVWRRDLSRVRSTSSAASLGIHPEMPHIDSAKARSAELARLDAHIAPVDSASSIEVDDTDFLAVQPFSRDRANSFYGGPDQEHVLDDTSGDDLGPLSDSQLRKMLDEDYDMFYHRQNGKENITPNAPDTCEVQKPSGESSPQAKRKSESSSAPGEIDSANVDESENDSSEKSKDSATSLRTYRTFQLPDEPEKFTVSIVSDDNLTDRDDEEDFRLLGDEITTLVTTSLDSPRVSSTTVPLFVEEIGRIPRAAIINGKVQRVKVNKVSLPSFITVASQRVASHKVRAAPSIANCLRGDPGEERSPKKSGGCWRKRKRRKVFFRRKLLRRGPANSRGKRVSERSPANARGKRPSEQKKG